MYLVFGGECYYAKGGMNDLKGKFEGGIEALMHADAGMQSALPGQGKYGAWDWYQVVDSNSLSVVSQSGVQPHGND